MMDERLKYKTRRPEALKLEQKQGKLPDNGQDDDIFYDTQRKGKEMWLKMIR